MKIKVGDKVFNSDDQPIMVILEDYEKELIQQMSPKNARLCVFPEGHSTEEIQAFMKLEDEK